MRRKSNNPDGRPARYRDRRRLVVYVEAELLAKLDAYREQDRRETALGGGRAAYRAEIVADALEAYLVRDQDAEDRPSGAPRCRSCGETCSDCQRTQEREAFEAAMEAPK